METCKGCMIKVSKVLLNIEIWNFLLRIKAKWEDNSFNPLKKTQERGSKCLLLGYGVNVLLTKDILESSLYQIQ